MDSFENVWIENDGNPNSNPDTSCIEDEAERALLNPKGEVMINDTIYIIKKNGWFEVYNGDMTIVGQIESGAITPSSEADTTEWKFKVAALPVPSLNGCVGKTRNRKTEWASNTSGDRKIHCILSFNNLPWKSAYKAKTKNYKVKSNGKLKKYKCECYARVYGYYFTSWLCDKDDFDEDIHWNSKRKAKAQYKKHDGIAAESEEGDVHGEYRGAGGVEHSMTL